MNFINEMKAALHRFHERQERKAQNCITAESELAIQVMEFNGQLYLSHGDVPLVLLRSADEATWQVCQARKTRTDYLIWRRSLRQTTNL